MIVILTIAYLIGFGQDYIQTEALTDSRVIYAVIAPAELSQFFTTENNAGIVPAAYRSRKPIPQYRSAPLHEVGVLTGDTGGFVWSHPCDASRHPT